MLARIKLEDDIIYRLYCRETIQESVIDRSIQQEGEAKKQREIAANLLRQGVTINIIASAMGLSVEEVQEIQQQLPESK